MIISILNILFEYYYVLLLVVLVDTLIRYESVTTPVLRAPCSAALPVCHGEGEAEGGDGDGGYQEVDSQADSAATADS